MNDPIVEVEEIIDTRKRKLNLIWETTQALIALMITLAVVTLALQKIEAREIIDAFFVIVGFYFSRTNSAVVGGVRRIKQ